MTQDYFSVTAEMRRPPRGPASGRPEDRLRGRVEGRMVLIQLLANSFTRSKAGVQGALQGVGSGFPLSRE